MSNIYFNLSGSVIIFICGMLIGGATQYFYHWFDRMTCWIHRKISRNKDCY